MSCIYEKIKCPRCGYYKEIEKRQEIVFCGDAGCGIYFDRLGKIREYDPISASARPLWDSFNMLANNK